jgi:hypothetical protein
LILLVGRTEIEPVARGLKIQKANKYNQLNVRFGSRADVVILKNNELSHKGHAEQKM